MRPVQLVNETGRIQSPGCERRARQTLLRWLSGSVAGRRALHRVRSLITASRMRPLTRHALTALAALMLMTSQLPAADAQSQLRLEIKESDIDIPGRTLHFRLTGGAVSSVDYEMFPPEGAKL